METRSQNLLQEESLTVAELAISHPGALAVFTKYNIDYCCGGHRSLREACHRIGVDPEKVKAEIYQSPVTSGSHKLHPDRWSSTFLVDYILENHHAYVRKAMSELEPLLDRVCERHGDDSYELREIQECFRELAQDLTSHMNKEEGVLFPTIKNLEREKLSGLPGYLKAPIGVMEHEHEVAGNLIKQIRSLSNNYTPPDFACPTFRITYQKLREFDDDLMQHIHLENNILFPRFKATVL